MNKTPLNNRPFFTNKLRYATIEPQAARCNVIITRLDIEYLHNLERLRIIANKLRQRKERQK